MKRKKMLKIVMIMFVVLTIIGACAAWASDTSSGSTDAPAESTTEIVNTTTDAATDTATNATTDSAADTATDAATESATESVNIDDLQPTYYKRVNDDKTGNWRVITFLASDSGEEDIVPLYNHYKTSDQEIFYMINLWTDVTYCVRNVGKNMISVTPTEHVDGEEATAKLLGSGASMGDDVFYDTTTGEQINF